MAVGVFAKLATSTELLSLLEVPDPKGMEQIRNQVIEDKYPSDLVESDLTRLCVYEIPSSTPLFSMVESNFIEIDIYVTKEKNKKDRRVLQIVNKLMGILHNQKIEGMEIRYYNRLPNLPTDNKEWVKYGVVFTYDSFLL